MWNEWAAKTTAWQYPRGSQHLDKLIDLFKTQKRARRAPIPTRYLDRDQPNCRHQAAASFKITEFA